MTSWTDESLGVSVFVDEHMPGMEVPLFAQDGTPLTDHSGNQLTARMGGTSWSDESMPS